MKKISRATFLRALDSSLSQVRTCEYGNSLFCDYTMLVQVEGVYMVSELRAYYKDFGTIGEENWHRFSSENEALDYFNACQEIAEEYSRNNNTVAGGN